MIKWKEGPISGPPYFLEGTQVVPSLVQDQCPGVRAERLERTQHLATYRPADPKVTTGPTFKDLSRDESELTLDPPWAPKPLPRPLQSLTSGESP